MNVHEIRLIIDEIFHAVIHLIVKHEIHPFWHTNVVLRHWSLRLGLLIIFIFILGCGVFYVHYLALNMRSSNLKERQDLEMQIYDRLKINNATPQEYCNFCNEHPEAIDFNKALKKCHNENETPKIKQPEVESFVTIASLSKVEPLMIAKLSQKRGRFVINTDGTVNDTESGLMWMRCPVGSTLMKAATGERLKINFGCGLANLYTWNEAQKMYSFSIYNDWRLPSRDELQTLHDLNAGDEIQGLAYINRDVFPMPDCYVNHDFCIFWSSSNNNSDYDPDTDTDNKAWVVYFQSNRDPKFVRRETKYMVRLVRNTIP